MGTASYVLLGTNYSMKETFGSTCQGAGRVMSRSAALKKFTNNEIRRELSDMGIYVNAASSKGIVEEAPAVYKNVDDVVNVIAGVGLSKIIARMVPLGVIKG
jgi:tRNA-splicing ligase RtcB